MSESTDLVRRVGFTIRQESVIPMPIDPTLSNEGEAADAKATGDAINAILGDLRINGKSPTNKAITLYGQDILMDGEAGAQTLKDAIESVGDKEASDIMYDSGNLISVKDAIDSLNLEMESDITDEDIDDAFTEVFGGVD